MIWHFHGKLASKQLLPIGSEGYRVSVDSWSASELLQGSLHALLDNAATSLEFVRAASAIDYLKDMGDKGVPLLDDRSNQDEISFSGYWHDSSSEGAHLFAVTNRTV